MRKAALTGFFVAVVAAVAVLLIQQRSIEPLSIKKNDPWILQSNDPNNKVGIYLGNGAVGTRIGTEGVGRLEGRPAECLMAGLYEKEAYLPLPNWSDFGLYDSDGKRFELDKEAPYRQTLNMREGYVETELTLKSGRRRLMGKVTVFVNRAKGGNIGVYAAAVRYELTPSFDGSVKLKESLDAGNGWKTKSSKKTGNGAQIFEGRSSTYNSVCVGTRVLDASNKPVTDGTSVKQEKSFALTKLIAIYNHPGYLSCTPASAEELLADVENVRYDQLFDSSKKAWRELWKSDIVIEGDPEAQQAVHSSMFYLLSSVNNGIWGDSIQPLGLSSSAYWGGHIFWDADVWMYPSLLLQHPELAGSIVSYRFVTRQAALENAKKDRLAGAEYAWESAESGSEAAPKPFSEERHITSDVALAQWQYYVATQDKEWLELRGWPVISACADYWASRAKYNSAKGKYEILKVVPPDENANIVDNCAYTNASAAAILQIAANVAGIIGKSPNPKWAETAGKMYIPFDKANKRYIEHDGYKGDATKQADVELMIYPWMIDMPDDVRTASFDYYKGKLYKNGPAMSSSVYAVISAQLGRRADAYKDFTESYKPFLRGPFLMFNEKRSSTWENTCFITGCGGMLQSVIYGFGGLRIGKNPGGFEEALPDLYIKPCLPERWKSLEIKNIVWRGKSYNLKVLPGDKWSLTANAPE
ncbi:MAG: hypothetical protein ABFD46_00535 [Armatimonadota bacterium]